MLLVPSIRVKGIAVSLAKLFVLYSIPYAALRLVGCTALNFAQAQLLASLMLLITSALPNVAGVGPMEFAFLLLFARGRTRQSPRRRWYFIAWRRISSRSF